MSARIAAVAALLLLSNRALAAPAVSKNDLTGTWLCGPTVMQGPNVTVMATYVVERKADMTFVDTGDTLVEPKDLPAFAFKSSTSGTWKLDGANLVDTTTEARFISSTNPNVTAERGQKVVEAEMQKKPVSTSKVLQINKNSMTKIAVKPIHAPAAVPSHCRRQS